MRKDVRFARPQRRTQTARVVARPKLTLRALPRSDLVVPKRDQPAVALPSSSWVGFQSDPYVDYARVLTPQGGIAIIYKDLDRRLRHTLRRLILWSSATAFAAWIVFGHFPARNPWISAACILAIAVVNWLIVSKPVETYRQIEIRPDCMIIEGADIFWLRHMEGGWPSFRLDDEGNQVLSGIYGTRYVEYVTIRRFDELDRTPEVIAAHLQDAMRQLWSTAHV